MKMRCCVTTLWSDRCRLITKTFLAFSRTSKRRHWSKLSTKKFFFLFWLYSEKNFAFRQRLAQSFTMWGPTKVYELITKIEWTNQSTRNALSEVDNLIIIIIIITSSRIVTHFAGKNGESGGLKCILASLNKPMKIENEMYDISSSQSKLRSHYSVCNSFLTALVKEENSSDCCYFFFVFSQCLSKW